MVIGLKTGMVLEGGGMRGSYSAGVLDCLMDENILVDYVVGVSAGACNGVSYVSRQRGRSFRVNSEYINDKRYVGLGNFFKTKSMFGMDFLFDEITNRLEPLDYKELLSNKIEFKIGVTDIQTGKPVYFDKSVMQNNADVLRASSSIPLFSPPVKFLGKMYQDGGTSDPIPVEQAEKDGCDRLLIILTRQDGYTKKKEKCRFLYKHFYKKMPKMIETMDNRHLHYQESGKYARRLEHEGKAIVLLPKLSLKVGRFEKNKKKLTTIYNLGYNDAKDRIDEIRKFLDCR